MMEPPNRMRENDKFDKITEGRDLGIYKFALGNVLRLFNRKLNSSSRDNSHSHHQCWVAVIVILIANLTKSRTMWEVGLYAYLWRNILIRHGDLWGEPLPSQGISGCIKWKRGVSASSHSSFPASWLWLCRDGLLPPPSYLLDFTSIMNYTWNCGLKQTLSPLLPFARVSNHSNRERN